MNVLCLPLDFKIVVNLNWSWAWVQKLDFSDFSFLGGYGSWSACTVSCGQGTRTRTCEAGACEGSAQITEPCKERDCPIDGGWSGWKPLGRCSKSCGSGTQYQYRTCNNPSRGPGGKYCVGRSSQYVACNVHNCLVHGGFTQWNMFGACSTSCGEGIRTSERFCTSPSPSGGGRDCAGDRRRTQRCNIKECIEGFTEWGEPGPCSTSCGPGQSTRSRSCTNTDGNGCQGPTTMFEDCNRRPCPIDGGFSEWSSAGPCSVSCGSGTRIRTRYCTNPSPLHGGKSCVGLYQKREFCNEHTCPTHGGFTTWSPFGVCSVSCGVGKRTRTRSCTNPAPSGDGDECIGKREEVEVCNERLCPIDGGFTAWSRPSQCSVSCGTGVTKQHRSCTNPPPSGGGKKCVGQTERTSSCYKGVCPGNKSELHLES